MSRANGPARQIPGRRSRNHSRVKVHTVGSDENIFEALELPDAPEWLAKAELARAIAREIKRRGLTQKQAANVVGGVQADVSNLSRGLLQGYSIERLMRFLGRLEQEVHVVVRPRARRRRRPAARVAPANRR